MAMHDQLEVFRSAVGLERAVIEIVRNLPRNCRPEISRRLIDHVEEIHEAANSAFGLLRQATHSHTDRAVLAGRLLRRGLPVDHRLTKAYRAAA